MQGCRGFSFLDAGRFLLLHGLAAALLLATPATFRGQSPDGANDPALGIALPPNSAPAAWYPQPLAVIDAWLAAHSQSPQAPRLAALRTALAGEAVRVTQGQVRRGDLWLPAEQGPEWADETAAEELLGKIQACAAAGDAAGLPALLPEISRHAKAAAHPRLVRAALAALDALLPGINAETAKAALQKQKDALGQMKDQETAFLRTALNHPVAGTPQPEGDNTAQYPDQLYRPPGTYATAHHYGLTPYYPSEAGYYPMLPDDELADLRKRAARIDDYNAQMAQIDQKMTQDDTQASQQMDSLAAQRKSLAPLPIDTEEATLAHLQSAASLDPAARLPILADAEAAWPGNQAAARLRLDTAEAALAAIDASWAQDDLPDAIRLQELAKSQDDMSTSGLDSPRIQRLRDAITASGNQVAAARDLQAAFDSHDYEPVLAGNIDHASPSLRDWLGRLQDRVRAQKEASRQQIARSIQDLEHLQLDPALLDFQKGRALWPANPEIHTDLQILGIAGVAAALLVLIFLLFLWERFSALGDALRYRGAMKGMKKAAAGSKRRKGKGSP